MDGKLTDIHAVEVEETKITITVGNTEISAVLNGSEAAREFAASLPTGISMTRMREHEYYGSLQNPLTHTEDLQMCLRV